MKCECPQPVRLVPRRADLAHPSVAHEQHGAIVSRDSSEWQRPWLPLGIEDRPSLAQGAVNHAFNAAGRGRTRIEF